MSSRRLGPNDGALASGAFACPHGRTTGVPLTTSVPDASVIADREVPPVREQRLRVRAEEAAEVRRVLERRVEVDVVADLDGKMQRRVLERKQLGSAGDELADALGDVLPGDATEREERVERRGLEDRAEAGGGEVEDAVADAEADAGRLPAVREDAEPDRALHGSAPSGSAPSASSSSIGSKKLQLPIERSRSSAGGRDLDRHRRPGRASRSRRRAA